MLNYSEEKRPAFFRRAMADLMFEGRVLEMWKGNVQLPKIDLDRKLDAELDEILGTALLANPRFGGKDDPRNTGK